MSDYNISEIYPSDKRSIRQMEALLHQEGILKDQNLDYSAGIFDEDYNLIATGSCFGNTLRCMAVDSSHQGEGLMNEIVSHLVDYQYRRGNMHLFLYTKCSTAKFFGDLGFHEIARVPDRVVFMENKRTAFQDYLENLKKETDTFLASSGATPPKTIGAIVMNANPFTLGHQYLVETASKACDLLHLFVVSEDASFFPYTVRRQLIEEGTAHLGNIVYHDTGSYLISNATFPSYFLKDEDTVIRSHASLDVAIFVEIAKKLGITCRFVGDEPFSQVTSIYNDVMKSTLEAHGLSCNIIPRLENEAGAISASKVRELIHDRNIAALKNWVPEPTFQFLMSFEAKSICHAIQMSDEVVHY